jgi:hypothetical protein
MILALFEALTGFCSRRGFTALIDGRFFCVINDENIDRGFCGYELESELFLDSVKVVFPHILSCLTGHARRFFLGEVAGFSMNREVTRTTGS